MAGTKIQMDMSMKSDSDKYKVMPNGVACQWMGGGISPAGKFAKTASAAAEKIMSDKGAAQEW